MGDPVEAPVDGKGAFVGDTVVVGVSVFEGGTVAVMAETSVGDDPESQIKAMAAAPPAAIVRSNAVKSPMTRHLLEDVYSAAATTTATGS